MSLMEFHNKGYTGRGNRSDIIWLGFVFVYLIVDLGIFQVIFSDSFLRLGLITTVLLFICLLYSGCIVSSVYRQSKLIIVFCGLLSSYILIAVNNYYAYFAFRNFAVMLPFLLSCIVLINSRKRLMIVCKGYGALLVFASVYALSNSGKGPGGILRDENDLSLFLITYLPLALFIAALEINKLKKILWMSSIFIMVMAIVITKSRGGFVGLCAVCAVYWWFSKKKITALAGIIMVGVVVVLIGGDSYTKDMSTITDVNESTARTRLLSWKAGFDMFVDNPLGVGGYNFPILFPEYQAEEMPKNMWGRAAHSLWFTLLPETGVFGLILYVSIVLMNFRDINTLLEPDGDAFFHLLAITLCSSLIGFFASATFLSVLYYPYFWHLTVMIMAARNLKDCESPVV